MLWYQSLLASKYAALDYLRISTGAKHKGRSFQPCNCRARVCVRNNKQCIYQTTPPTSELNLIWYTPQEPGFLFRGDVSPKQGLIRALWMWSICNRVKEFTAVKTLSLMRCSVQTNAHVKIWHQVWHELQLPNGWCNPCIKHKSFIYCGFLKLAEKCQKWSLVEFPKQRTGN